MRARITIDAEIDDDLVTDLEDGYGASAGTVADSVRRDLGANEYLVCETARIDVAIGHSGERPVAAATTYEQSRRVTT